MKKAIITAVLAACTVATSSAADFFSTGECDELLTFGARIGLNTSNRTMSDDAFPGCYHHENWGTGFDIGAVVSINIRDYLAVQPGLFFETRSGSNVLMGSAAGSAFEDDGSELAQASHRSSYNLTVPVMAAFRFNVTDDLRWNVEAGPYVSFVLGSSLKNKYFIVDGEADRPLFAQKAAPVDFGFKFGTGLDILGNYYVGVHYMAGCLDSWKNRKVSNLVKTYGGVTKAWVFTVGYNF